MNETKEENKTLIEEYGKLKALYEISLRNNMESSKVLKDYMLLQEVFSKQTNQLITLNDKIKHLELESKGKEDEINKFKNQMKDKDNKISKLNKDLKFQLQINERNTKNLTEMPNLQNKVNNYEKRISELEKKMLSHTG